MKKLFLLAGFAMFYLGAFAQNVEVKEGSASMSKGSQNGFSVELIKTNAEFAADRFKDFCSDKYDFKCKYDKKTKEFAADNVKVKGLSDGNDLMDVFATFRQNGENTTMTVFFDLGGAYLNSQAHSSKVPNVKTMLSSFAVVVSRGMIEDNLNAEKKKLEKLQENKKDLEKDKKDLEKDVVDFNQDIENYKKKIAEAENKIKDTQGKIAKNGESQVAKQKEVDAQNEVVKEIQKRLDGMK